MSEPVEQRPGEPLGAYNLDPCFERQVGGDDQPGAFIALGAASVYEKDIEPQAEDFVKCTGDSLYPVTQEGAS